MAGRLGFVFLFSKYLHYFFSYLDGAPDIQGLKRGKWSGAGLSTQEISFPLDDFIKSLEYYYEGVVIYGIRFGRI